MGYEIFVILSTGMKVTVFAKNIDEYGKMINTIITENIRRAERNQYPHTMIDGRIMKRGPHKAITVQEFNNAFF